MDTLDMKARPLVTDTVREAGSLDHYTLLADLFVYPDEGFGAKIDHVLGLLSETYPGAVPHLEAFSAYVGKNDQHALEEIFLRSFDVQAISTLDIGYVLFGDDYKRGAVLVNMNREHEAVGNPCHDELADHLPNVLRLIPLLKDEAFRTELVDRLVAPALRKIIAEFNPKRIDAKQKVYRKHHNTLLDESARYRTIYSQPLEALYEVIAVDFTLSKERPPEPSSDFLKNIHTEIKLETDSESPNISQSCSL